MVGCVAQLLNYNNKRNNARMCCPNDKYKHPKSILTQMYD